LILGIGTDLTSIPRTRRLIERWGERFLNKTFTPAEIGRLAGRRRAEEEFAALFAAKEATMKALGQGLLGGVRFRDIEITSDPYRRPSIVLRGRAHELAERAGVGRIHVSLTHEGDYAAAQVVMEK
jgi:holo-[acyl-carrier protein] synthase